MTDLGFVSLTAAFLLASLAMVWLCQRLRVG